MKKWDSCVVVGIIVVVIAFTLQAIMIYDMSVISAILAGALTLMLVELEANLPKKGTSWAVRLPLLFLGIMCLFCFPKWSTGGAIGQAVTVVQSAIAVGHFIWFAIEVDMM